MAMTILVYESDLIFSSRIESTIEKAGLEVKTTTTMTELRDNLKRTIPEVLLVNLDALEERRESLADLLPLSSCRVVGYYSHMDARAAEEALRSGFEMVIPRRSFMVKLNEILESGISSR